MGSGQPVRRFDALRAWCTTAVRAAEAARRPSLRFRSPPEASSRAPQGPARPWARLPDPASSPGLLRPYDTFSVRRPARPWLPPRPSTACGVWLPPARHSSARLPARETPERPWASPSRACSPWRRELLSESLPSWRCRPARRTMTCTREHGRLQGLALATDPYRRRSLGDRPSLPSWASPPQSHPTRPGTALWSRGLPSHPSRRADVPARQGLKVSRIVAGRDIRLRMPQLSRGCSPHDGRGAPFAGAGDWRMAWPRSGCAALAAVPLLCIPWRPAQPVARAACPAPPSVGD